MKYLFVFFLVGLFVSCGGSDASEEAIEEATEEATEEDGGCIAHCGTCGNDFDCEVMGEHWDECNPMLK